MHSRNIRRQEYAGWKKMDNRIISDYILYIILFRIIVLAILNTQQFFQFQKYLSFIYFSLFIATVLSGTKNLLKI